MRPLFYTLLSICLIAPAAFAADAPVKVTARAETKAGSETDAPDFRGSLFVIETDEAGASDSLNRISGDRDRGYSSPEQTYRSKNQKITGGALQQSQAKANEYSST